jgi:hypothetical protein
MVFVLAGIIGDASALFSQWLLGYVLYAFKLASRSPFPTTGIRRSPVNQNMGTMGHLLRMKSQGSPRPEYE